MHCRIHFPTNDSRCLLSIEVSDIGRRSDSIDLGGLTLGIGTTFPFFQLSFTSKFTLKVTLARKHKP